MSYLEFDKKQLINLEYSLNRETLRTNRAGSFASTTIIDCHTRKYHGLLICPLETAGGGNHLLLSALDVTIIQHEREFHLAVRKYPSVFHPGHKYIRDYTIDPIPTVTYRVGGVILKREKILIQNEERILIRYTLEDAHSPTILRFHPFLAFRNVHSLNKANMNVLSAFDDIPNGIRTKMYSDYPYLNMQFSRKVDYYHAPDWFYNVEYIREKERGYDYLEDLFVPGFFELSMKKGDVLVFSAGLQKESEISLLENKFTNEIKSRIPRSNYENCLINSAKQFIVNKNNKTEIIAGYPWFGKSARDACISLPGLTLAIDDTKTCKAVLDGLSKELNGALFSENRDSVDAPLWYIWTVQQYYLSGQPAKNIWADYSEKITNILTGFREGTDYNIFMLENGLIYGGKEGFALTWMDAVVDNQAVTARIGCPVEVNALWYNAIMFSLEIARIVNDFEFIARWESLPVLIRDSFIETFWINDKNYLADYVNGDYKNTAVRPNQLFATSLPYSPLDDEKSNAVLEIIDNELLTPKGIRSLSPENSDYKGICAGNQKERDIAYHQGTIWPWLLGHFAEAYLKLHEKSGVSYIKKLYNGFEQEMAIHGIGTIPELYGGNPPYESREAISKAWSVAELLRVRKLLTNYE